MRIPFILPHGSTSAWQKAWFAKVTKKTNNIIKRAIWQYLGVLLFFNVFQFIKKGIIVSINLAVIIQIGEDY